MTNWRLLILTEKKNNKAEKKNEVMNPKVFVEFMLLLLSRQVTTEISKHSSLTTREEMPTARSGESTLMRPNL